MRDDEKDWVRKNYWYSRMKLIALTNKFNELAKDPQMWVKTQSLAEEITFELQRLQILKFRLRRLGISEEDLIDCKDTSPEKHPVRPVNIVLERPKQWFKSFIEWISRNSKPLH